MRVIKTVEGLICYLAQRRKAGAASTSPEVGLVPTMGNLHGGHRSLIERARRENDVVIVSIFINPLQFGPQEDLARYPQTPSQDLQICEQGGWM